MKTPASFETVWLHARDGGAVGVVPASLGCAVLDVDRGGQDACQALEQALGEPLAVLPSKTEGRFHFWLRVSDAGTGRNALWELGSGGGEIHAAMGSITLWSDPAPLIEALEAGRGQAVTMAAVLGATRPPGKKSGKKSKARLLSVVEAPVGQRNEALNRMSYLAGVRGANPEVAKVELLKDAIEAGLPEDEALTTIDSGLTAGLANMRPMVSNDREGFSRALETMGAAIRFNLLKLEMEVRRSDTWQAVNDRLVDTLRLDLAESFTMPAKEGNSIPFYLTRDRWTELVNASIVEINPVAEWLEGLPQWDGTERLTAWLDDLFELTGDNDLAAWTSSFIPLGVVWRTFRPGTKMDEMPVLIGPEGIGKSTVLKQLLPPEMQSEWFSDSLQFAARLREKAEALQGHVIVEVAEMAGIGTAQLDALKGFLSRTNDGGARLAFRRNPEPMLRRCVIVGTTNADMPLPADPSGNRRFVPVSMAGGNPTRIEAYMKLNRDQIWAEAIVLYRGGVSAWLPKELREMQRDTVEEYRFRNDSIEDRLMNIEREDVTFDQAGVMIGLAVSENDVMKLDSRLKRELGSALRNVGRIRVRVREKSLAGVHSACRKTFWRLPKNDK